MSPMSVSTTIISKDKEFRKRLTIETSADLDDNPVYIDDEPSQELWIYYDVR
jgi:hypothetical protein